MVDPTYGIITAPVSIADVKSVLNANSNDLGTLCVNGNINRWSKHKPVKYTKISELTEAEFASTGYGFNNDSSSSYSGLKKYANGDIQIVNYKYILITKLPEYIKPTSYFRLTDFDGYCHKAAEPILIEKHADNGIMIDEWCWTDGIYFSDGQGRNAIITNNPNVINFRISLHDSTGLYSVDFSQIVGSGLKEYSIGVVWVKSDFSTNPQYLIMNTGIKLSETNTAKANEILDTDNSLIFRAVAGSGYLSIWFSAKAFIYEGMLNWLNGYNGSFFSKLILVPSNGTVSPVTNKYYGINKNISIADCYSIDTNDNPGFFLSKDVIADTIPYRPYIYAVSNNFRIFKYKGSSGYDFDTTRYDYYRLTTAYRSSEQYSGYEQYHAITSSNQNAGAVTYQSGSAPVQITPPIQGSIKIKIEFSTSGECGFIRRKSNTSYRKYESVFKLNDGVFNVYPDKTASPSTSGSGSGLQTIYSKYTATSDEPYDEIWFFVGKDRLQSCKLTLYTPEETFSANLNIIQ